MARMYDATVTIADTLQQGLEHQRAGRLDIAEAVYRTAVDTDPSRADAWHLLGTIELMRGNCEAAVTQISRALALDAGVAAFHCNLGSAQLGLGLFDEAIASFLRAIEIFPDYSDAHNNLGNAYFTRRNLVDAEQ